MPLLDKLASGGRIHRLPRVPCRRCHSLVPLVASSGNRKRSGGAHW